jgi:hypothetical protein
MKRIFGVTSITFLITLLSVGCHAQVPPTTWQVSASWAAPIVNGTAECTTTNVCTYVVSRTVPVGGVCPAVTGTTYVQVATATNNATQVSDLTVTAGQAYCYIVQTQQVIPPATQAATSSPSNVAQVTVPANPQPPTAPTVTPTPGTTQSGSLTLPENLKPSPLPTVYSSPSKNPMGAPSRVTVVLVARR